MLLSFHFIVEFSLVIIFLWKRLDTEKPLDSKLCETMFFHFDIGFRNEMFSDRRRVYRSYEC